MEVNRRTLLQSIAAGTLAAASPTLASAQPKWQRETRDDLAAAFKKLNTEGTFALLDAKLGRLVLVNAERAARGFIPVSTFKIPNSLIALETGVVADADHPVFKWDGTKYDFAAWNRDHTLRTAFRASAVWVYQDIARKIGEQRMREFVGHLGYGNGDIGGGIDQFWLGGNLRISAIEQVEFLQRLEQAALSVSKRAQAVVRDIMLMEEGEGYTLRGKTGLELKDNRVFHPAVGWLVGWVERGPDAYLYAMNMDVVEQRHIADRLAVSKELLKALKVL